MERTLLVSLVVGLALATVGCDGGGGDPVCGDADGLCPVGCPTDPDCSAGTDAGTNVDGGGDVDGGGSACATATIPTPPYGVELGRKFEPITLEACDGTPYEFYGPEYCDAQFTVVSIAAGWCGPCIIESGLLTDRVTNVYGPRGVRVIQVIYQTDDYGPPDGAYCDAWVSRFDLTNIELIDPTQLMSQYFPAGALPATLIVDSTGTIVFREYGVSSELMSLTAKLDELLAGM